MSVTPVTHYCGECSGKSTEGGDLVSKNRLSYNVGGVKHFSRTLQRALLEERHFALDEWFAFSNQPGLACNLSGQELVISFSSRT